MDTKTKNLLFNNFSKKEYTIVFNGKEFSYKDTDIVEDDSVTLMFAKFLRASGVVSTIDSMCILYKEDKPINSMNLFGLTGGDSYKLLNADFNTSYESEPVNEVDTSILNSMNEIKQPFNNRDKLLDDFNIVDNKLYFYFIDSWLEEIQQTFESFESDKKKYNGIIRKYWPFIRRDYRDNLKENHLQFNKSYENELSMLKSLNIEKKFKRKETIKPDNFDFIHLGLELQLDKEIDINILFDNIELSKELPCSMIFKKYPIDTRYKIFKESTHEISLPLFKRWINGIELISDTDFFNYNSRDMAVSFYIQIKQDCYVNVNIHKKGLIELLIDHNNISSISLRENDKNNINISNVITTVNSSLLTPCKQILNDIEILDNKCLENTNSKTKIQELGGKFNFIIEQKCSENAINIENKIDEKIPKRGKSPSVTYSPFLRRRDEQISDLSNRQTFLDKGYRFVYKKKSNYTSLNSVEAVIIPYIDQVPELTIRDIVKEVFTISDAKALEITRQTIENHQETTNKSIFKKDRIEKGIFCRIHDLGTQIEIVFDSINSVQELKRLSLFLCVFISDVLGNYPADKLIKLKKLPVPKAEPKKAEPEPEDDESDDDESDSDDDEFLEFAGGGIKMKSYSLNLIKEHDKEFLKYPWSTKCQGQDGVNRHPYIIPNINDLKRISDLWKQRLTTGKYKDFFKDYEYDTPFGDWDYINNRENFRNEPDTKVKWVRAGRSYDKLSFYLCSKLWCVRCKSPIPTENEEDDCPFCKCQYYGNRKKTGAFEELTTETIIDRNEIYWDNADVSTPGFIEPRWNEEHAANPDYPLLNIWPCCFKTKSAAKKWDPGATRKSITGKPTHSDIEPGKILSEGSTGVVHPDIMRILSNDDKIKFKRYGINQDTNESLLYSMGCIVADRMKISIDDFKKSIINVRPEIFLATMGGELVVKYKQPYSEIDKHIDGLIKWTRNNFAFLRKYGFSGPDSITKKYGNINKKNYKKWIKVDKGIWRLLYNLYTAIQTFGDNLSNMVGRGQDYTPLLELVNEMYPELYICMFVIEDQIKIMYPSKQNTVNEVAFILYHKVGGTTSKFNQSACEPLIMTIDKKDSFRAGIDKSPDFERVVNWCQKQSMDDNKYYLKPNSLPMMDDEFLHKVKEIQDKTERQDSLYYLDNWGTLRYILMKHARNKYLYLPVYPDRFVIDNKKSYEYTGRKQEITLKPFFQLSLAKLKMEQVLKYINVTFKEFYKINGVFISGENAVGFSVNEGNCMYFSKIPITDVDKKYKRIPFFGDNEIEKEIMFDEFTLKNDVRQKLNEENALYHQYKKEISHLLTPQDIYRIKKLSGIDIYSDDKKSYRYLIKAMWDSDKRDEIFNIVKSISDKHTKLLLNTDKIKSGDSSIKGVCGKYNKHKGTTKIKSIRLRKTCNKYSSCYFEQDICKFKIGGVSHFNGQELYYKFVDMITDDLYIGGIKGINILNNNNKIDTRLKNIYKQRSNEILLRNSQLKDALFMKDIFKKIKLGTLSKKFEFIQSGGRRKTQWKKKQRKTYRKKNKRRTHRKNRKRRTVSK